MDESVLTNNNRVIADGGIVTDNTLMESYVNAIKVRGLWDKCIFFLMGVNGVKKNENDYCEKLYDLKGNADMLQSDILRRPRHKRTGALLVDGADGMMSDALGISNPIRTATKITAMGIIKLSNISTFQHIMSRFEASTSSKGTFIISTGAGSPNLDKLRFIIGNSSGITSGAKLYYSSIPIVIGESMHFAMTYDNNDLKVYINGVLDTGVVKTSDGATGLLHNNDQPISIIRFNNGLQPIVNLGKIGALQIYNDVLTPEEILWSARYVKPIMQREVYGEVVGSHIDRAEDAFAVIDNACILQSVYDYYKANNMWNNCTFLTIPSLTGCTRDTNSYVNKLFDLVSQTDLTQATGANQPRFVNESLVFDGGDILVSNVLSTNNPIRLTNSKMTCYVWVYISQLGVEQSIVARWGLGNNHPTCLFMLEVSPTSKFRCIIDDGAKFVKDFSSSSSLSIGWNLLLFTYDTTMMDGAIQGLLKLFVNSVEQSLTKTVNMSNSSIRNFDRQIQISGINNTATTPIANGGRVYLAGMHNDILTQDQINGIYDNVRPVGV